MKTLDRTKPVTEIRDASGSVMLEQDGQLFNLAGEPLEPIGHMPMPEPSPPPVPIPEREPEPEPEPDEEETGTENHEAHTRPRPKGKHR